MMDVFVEQIVKKKFGIKDDLIIAAVIVVGLILAYFSLLIRSLTVFIIAGICFGAYYLITSRSLEFEYSITNGDITIDKIISKRKRKRVVSTDARYVEEIGKYTPGVAAGKRGYTRYFASVYDDGRGGWYFCAHDAKKGNILVVFNPEEKVLEAIKPFLPRQVAFVAFGRN